MKEIFKEIKQERQRQDAIWGGPVHDSGHNQSDFFKLIRWQNYKYERDTDKVYAPKFWTKLARKRFINIAALAVAAIENIDRETQSPSAKAAER